MPPLQAATTAVFLDEGQQAAFTNQTEDLDLVQAAQHADVRAFETLMRRHNRRLFRVARSILRDADAAEDAVQEAYIRAYKNLSQYAPTGSFAAWLTRVAVNEALMLKRKARRGMIPLDSVDDGAVVSGDEPLANIEALVAADELDQTGLRQALEQAVDRLPEEFRTVFILRAVEQLSTAETANCLGLNSATVKTRLHRARARLRAELTRRFRREQSHLFEFGGARCDRIVERVLLRLAGFHPHAAPLASAIAACAVALFAWAAPDAALADDRPDDRRIDSGDLRTDLHALKEVRKGREIFRYATFGDEDFWGGTLGLHEAIAGAANGGVGPGLSPKAALSLGLKVDVDALPGRVRRAIKSGASGALNLNDPAVTIELLRLDAVVGITGFFDDARRLKSVGIQCSLCHSVVDNSFSEGIGERRDGWANRDLNIGAIVALAPRLQAFSDLLGVDVADRAEGSQLVGAGQVRRRAHPRRQGFPSRRQLGGDADSAGVRPCGRQPAYVDGLGLRVALERVRRQSRDAWQGHVLRSASR